MDRVDIRVPLEPVRFEDMTDSRATVAWRVADLERSADIGKEHVLEAIQHRRYCEGDVYWNYK